MLVKKKNEMAAWWEIWIPHLVHHNVFIKKKKNLASAIMNWWGRYEFITPAYSYYARLFLLRPVLCPGGCYGHVYVFRILRVIMQLY
jgi:hypothetical protein